VLLAAACLLGLVALRHARRRAAWRWHWALLALGFAWLSEPSPMPWTGR
jgi:hypothetical protein